MPLHKSLVFRLAVGQQCHDRRRWRGCAMVCHQIGDGEIVLMAQACHDRYGVVRQEAAKDLVVEHC